MENNMLQNYIKEVLENMPDGWLNLTTHRLDIYDEKLAKTQFLEEFESLFNDNIFDSVALNELPTAFDYIRLGHPLSCMLEWVIAKTQNISAENVISFSSKTVPVLAILRKNLLANKNTQIMYKGSLPTSFDAAVLRNIYGYQFDLQKVETVSEVLEFNGSTIFISQQDDICNFNLSSAIDFFINLHDDFGSVLVVNGEKNENYISEIQHVRRRETIAMTPANSLTALKTLIKQSSNTTNSNVEADKTAVLDSIKKITNKRFFSKSYL